MAVHISRSVRRRLTRAFTDHSGLLSHQLESTEVFLHYHIRDIINDVSPVIVDIKKTDREHIVHEVNLENPVLLHPVSVEADGFFSSLTPEAAIARKQNLNFEISIDVRHQIYEVKDRVRTLTANKLHQNVAISKFPAMVGTSASGTDSGSDFAGSFIINGNEKTLIAQTTIKPNFPFVTEKKGDPKYLQCEIRSAHPTKLRST